MKKLISVILAIALIICFSGCQAARADNLIVDAAPTGAGDVTPTPPGTPAADSEAGALAAADFSVRLFQRTAKAGENTLISPLSVLYALTMTANGGAGETLAQMETVLGMPVEDLNGFLHEYMKSLPSEKLYKLSLVNSIWFKDDPRLTVEPDFLQTNVDYYGAGIFKAPFDDSTLKAINDWVKENTDGMIPDILNEIPEEAVMYLVNALAFDAQWETIYREEQIAEGPFTTEDGVKQRVPFMHSKEGKFLEDDSATGFIKYYADRTYAFVALLPNEGIPVEDYVAGLTGAHLAQLLSHPEDISVLAAIPKFETEYTVEMSDILTGMGMTDAFAGNAADFSRLGSFTEGNLYINAVIHKTYIAVDERGTKAGAATAVEMLNESVSIEETKTVTLDRPFVYMLIDCQTNLPFFIGTMMDVTGD